MFYLFYVCGGALCRAKPATRVNFHNPRTMLCCTVLNSNQFSRKKSRRSTKGNDELDPHTCSPPLPLFGGQTPTQTGLRLPKRSTQSRVENNGNVHRGKRGPSTANVIWRTNAIRTCLGRTLHSPAMRRFWGLFVFRFRFYFYFIRPAASVAARARAEVFVDIYYIIVSTEQLLFFKRT